ncbi:hypothetical protein [Poseidonocella sp. HB161398]|uniref:hypothetical protein n=1 Tax=Poseidonocella sp. HB161398 TaxID=2320855 RepID=UPI001486D9B0|nr:hypothetical protein [Poseidonocella sp. HB161398]
MPEDSRDMADDSNRSASAAEIRELRDALRLAGRKLRALGEAQARHAEEELGETFLEIEAEGRRILTDFERRTRDAERRIEQNMRQHPAGWIGGLLGVVGFGLVLGMILRSRE